MRETRISINLGSRIRLPMALAVGAILTVAILLGVNRFVPRENYLWVFLLDRSWIQYLSLLIFWVAMATIAYDHWMYRRELSAVRRGCRVLDNLDIGEMLLWTDASRVAEAFAGERGRGIQQSILFSRVHNAMERVRKTRSPKVADDYFRSRGEIDKSQLETSFAEIRYFIWLIPILGFIGTVMGIGQGIAGFADVLESVGSSGGGEASPGGVAGVQWALPKVTQCLGTAFDTTFLALLLSAVAVFYMSYLLKRREALLQETDRICCERIGALFQEDRGEMVELVRALDERSAEIRAAINGHRGALEKAIGEGLPDGLVTGLAAGQARLYSLLWEVTQLLAHLARVQARQLPADDATRAEIEALVEQVRAEHMEETPPAGSEMPPKRRERTGMSGG